MKGKEMSKLLKTLTAAHLNALNATIKSVEVQISALKVVVGGLPTGDKPETDEVEADEDETTTGKTTIKRGKVTKVEPDEDEETETDEDEETEATTDEDEETETEDEDEDDETSSKREAKPTLVQVKKALREFSKENDRPSALKILRKVGGVKTVDDLAPSKFSKVLKALAA